MPAACDCRKQVGAMCPFALILTTYNDVTDPNTEDELAMRANIYYQMDPK